tara:strand:+ start:27708 stop:27896 length:189 start_codon:yes stop_codon:yes gene_type:complete
VRDGHPSREWNFHIATYAKQTIVWANVLRKMEPLPSVDQRLTLLRFTILRDINIIHDVISPP